MLIITPPNLFAVLYLTLYANGRYTYNNHADTHSFLRGIVRPRIAGFAGDFRLCSIGRIGDAVCSIVYGWRAGRTIF
jgi:hypothetical protein